MAESFLTDVYWLSSAKRALRPRREDADVFARNAEIIDRTAEMGETQQHEVQRGSGGGTCSSDSSNGSNGDSSVGIQSPLTIGTELRWIWTRQVSITNKERKCNHE